MSSIFEVTAQLVLLLSVALSSAETVDTRSGAFAAHEIPEHTASAPVAIGEQVWLEAVMGGSGSLEVRNHAARVFKTTGGKYYVPSETEHAEIDRLRRDPSRVAEVTLSFAARNARRLRQELGRPVTVGDLYIAHALGGEAAAALLKAESKHPNALLREGFANLIARHPELDGGRRPVRIGEVVRRLKQAAERRPEGADVAVWFANGSERFASIALKGAVDEDPHAAAPYRTFAPVGWAAVVEARR